MSTLACSSWAAKNNYKTLKDVPNFPYVGGAYVAPANCGDCYSIFDEQTGKLIDVTVVDAAGTGFVISLAALNNVTNGNAVNLGSIQADVGSVPNSRCQK